MMATGSPERAEFCYAETHRSPPFTPTPPIHAHDASCRINDDRRRYAIFISPLSTPVDSSKEDVTEIRTFEARSTMLEDLSRSSSPASEAASESPPESIISDDNSVVEMKQKPMLEGDFEIEEIHSTEIPVEQELETLRPIQYEDPESDVEYRKPKRWSMRQQEMEEETGIINGLQSLCTRQDRVSENTEQERLYQRTRNRYSAGKRTYSQSIESGSDEQDDCDISLQDLESCTRRLRRRVKRASDRNSFVFNDQSEEHALAEVEEPDDDGPQDSASLNHHTHIHVKDKVFIFNKEDEDVMDIDQNESMDGNFI